MKLTITVRCVLCKAVKKITAPHPNQPMCDKCFMPMVAESAALAPEQEK